MDAGEGHIALAELLMAQTTAKQMALRDVSGRPIGIFMFDVREYREDAVDDEQVQFMAHTSTRVRGVRQWDCQVNG